MPQSVNRYIPTTFDEEGSSGTMNSIFSILYWQVHGKIHGGCDIIPSLIPANSFILYRGHVPTYRVKELQTKQIEAIRSIKSHVYHKYEAIHITYSAKLKPYTLHMYSA